MSLAEKLFGSFSGPRAEKDATPLTKQVLALEDQVSGYVRS